jgi:hypothetical protein
MLTLDGDNIIETTETTMSVKELRAREKAINDEIDLVNLEPDEMVVPTGKQAKLLTLRAERDAIVATLQSVNLT